MLCFWSAFPIIFVTSTSQEITLLTSARSGLLPAAFHSCFRAASLWQNPELCVDSSFGSQCGQSTDGSIITWWRYLCCSGGLSMYNSGGKLLVWSHELVNFKFFARFVQIIQVCGRVLAANFLLIGCFRLSWSAHYDPIRNCHVFSALITTYQELLGLQYAMT